ncbi:hypothetical protein [Archangium primigenium]|uniref:hypothetical protein n=1 Tax=[Archangium] primigenium TaxID=2792470 RepID=UPI0019585ECE|nr:hypothetical protein [Archangium primigenium]MBM7112836.1 hypothetical protein [Archangium primigenium]
MADDQEREGGVVGGYRLGRAYDEVGPDLGRLHEARHVDTGKPVLMFLPGDRVHWRPQGEWALKISCRTEPTVITLEVDRAPPGSPRATNLADVLTLGTAAFQRVEDNPELEAHLFGPPPAPEQEQPKAAHPWRWAAAGVAMLTVGVGLWALTLQPKPDPTLSPILGNRAPVKAAIAYPLPSKPFSDQAATPCVPALGEVEINGGCWMELAQKAPCIVASQAEHKGKCYLPVSKERPLRPPTSLDP